MIEFYPQIKHAHIMLALASGGLFALRGVLALAGSGRLARALPLRILSWSIDTLLLTAALMLLVVLRLNPVATPWLAVKLVALVVYVWLGHAALRSTRGRARQALWLLSALAVFGFMYSVARSHHPLGLFAGMLG
jgi:uncharacterized membrane protein SirB2